MSGETEAPTVVNKLLTAEPCAVDVGAYLGSFLRRLTAKPDKKISGHHAAMPSS